MTWTERTSAIAVGSRVCYSRRFLQDTGQVTGELPFARGIVTDIEKVGDLSIATVDWADDGIPPQVNLANLSRITAAGIAE